jgi:pantoate--beta-alanine ligase
MSTRNQYLSSEERAVAPQLYKILERTRQDYLLSSSVIDLKKDMHSDLEKYFDLDYAEIVDANTLKQITDNTTEIAILCAVLLGSTRLIDNIIFWR